MYETTKVFASSSSCAVRIRRTVAIAGRASLLAFCLVGFTTEMHGDEMVSLVLEPSGEERAVYVKAPALKTGWRLRIPERILSDPEMIQADHAHRGGPKMVWNNTGKQGVVSEFCEATASQGEGKIAFKAEVTPVEGGLNLLFTVRNQGDKTLKNVAGHYCLSHDHRVEEGGERFAENPTYRRTYIVTDRGLVSLADTDRGGNSNKMRSHYLIQGAQPISYFQTQVPVFWGVLSKAVVVEPWIAGVSKSGAWTVALWWEKALELFQNSDTGNRCIHSDAAFGDVAPGQTATVRGGLDLVHGGPDLALQRYRERRR